ncbi:hypothetical protein [Polaribacter sp. HaHaR_3_91]|jgi:hypothetical protein|uniref:hypothetical protein n=1 Tax=Polaribacter sp. HaHaR_3_91 TaxID=2745561 RepID=UPI001C501EB6|nr:hypothetical protein [Polaribacter sp. HaHaR_3_91]QXP62656.1 hypothetical protein H0I27_12305 [Polaribacter sp. HaHaR_3_91]
MTIEIIIFIAAILFGIVIYWRESRGNKMYLFFNKVMNSEELQMKDTDTKGFVFQQNFVLRFVYIAVVFLIGILIVQFLIPINYATISLFASMIFGTLIGTYIAGAIFKSSEIIEEQTEAFEDKLEEIIEKGKDFVEDFKEKDNKEVDVTKEVPKVADKSARERLKDKGLL